MTLRPHFIITCAVTFFTSTTVLGAVIVKTFQSWENSQCSQMTLNYSENGSFLPFYYLLLYCYIPLLNYEKVSII